MGVYPDPNAIYYNSYEMVLDRMEQLQVRKISPETVRKVEEALPPRPFDVGRPGAVDPRTGLHEQVYQPLEVTNAPPDPGRAQIMKLREELRKQSGLIPPPEPGPDVGPSFTLD